MKYYGSCFSSPESSNATGILGILGILVTPQPALAGLLALTSSTALSNATSQSQKLQPIQPHPTAPNRTRAGLLGLTSSNPHFPTQRAKPRNSSPANPRSAQPLTCPSLRLTAASGWATPPRFAPLRRRPAPSFGRRQPAATLRYAPLRSATTNCF